MLRFVADFSTIYLFIHSMDFLNTALALASGATFVEQPIQKHWSKCEAGFGVTFSPGIKRFISAFGSGIFGHDLCILYPASGRRNRLMRFEPNNVRERMELLDVYHDSFEHGWLERGNGILPISTCSTRVNVCAVVSNNYVNDNVLVVGVSGRNYYDYGVGIAEFVVRLYENDLMYSDSMLSTFYGHPKAPFFTPATP